MLPEYLFIAFIFIVSIQCIYYLFFLFFFKDNNSSVNYTNLDPVSVIICAKNEEKNLANNLQHFINQKYPNFEIVLVNDGSSDNTLEVIKSYKNSFASLIKIVDVEPNEQFWGSKKYALTLGIKAATHNLLVFSDADCYPLSENWLTHISHKFSEKKTIVLGYGAYEKVKNSLLNKLIRFETVTTLLQYISYAKAGFPYMGVGRNLAYKKELFFENAGFSNHMHVKSGDDDLFVNNVATKSNIEVCLHNESFTISTPKKSFKEWYSQKRRHISTSALYKLKHKVMLGLFALSQILFWITFPLLLFYYETPLVIISLIFIRFLVQFALFYKVEKTVFEMDLLIFTPFLEIFLILTQITIFINNLISKPKHW